MAKKRKPQYEPFAKNLRNAFEKWQTKTGGTQETLAEKIGVADRKSISDWLNARSYPTEENMESLCEILNVTENELLKFSRQEKYRYDKDFTLEIHEKFQTFCEALGLNHDFLKFVKSAIPDEEFPVYSPVCYPDLMDENFERATLMEAFECDTQNEYQRRLSDGKTINLSHADYAFLKEVQDNVCSYIEYLFYKRKKEMEEDVQNINANNITRKGGAVFVKHPSANKMLELDRFRKYATEEYIQEVLNNGKNNKKK